MYWHCHRIEEWSYKPQRTVWRRPYYREIKQKFPTLGESTIDNWIRDQEKILNAPKNSRIVRDYWLPYWPKIEEELMQRFRARGAENKLVGHRWLLKNASEILVEYILNTLLHLPSLKAGCNESSGEMGSPGDELLDRLQSYQLFLLLLPSIVASQNHTHN
jgi:hypothetical protein